MNPTAHNKINYTDLKTRLNKIIKLTQKAQNGEFIHNSRYKCNAAWSIINQNKLNSPKNYIDHIVVNDTVISEPTQLVNSLKFFLLIRQRNLVVFHYKITVVIL